MINLKKSLTLGLLLAGTLSFLGQESYSAEDTAGKSFEIGGLIGFQTSSVPGSSAQGLSYGGRFNLNFAPNWGMGAEMNAITQTPVGVATGTSTYMNLYLIDMHYLFTGGLQGLYLGAAVGFASYKWYEIILNTPMSGYYSSLAVGGNLGYDFPLMAGLSIGPKLNFTYVSAPPVLGGASATTLIQGFLQIKYNLL